MRFERVARKLWCEPWIILPRMHNVIAGVFAAHVNDRSNTAGLGDLFEPQEPEKMDIQDGVAVIPVRGVISREISSMERISGACDVEDIARMIGQAENDPNVRAAVFDMDTPGGGVEGVMETAEIIRAMKKPTISHTASMMASAGYWLGSAANAVYATGSSTVGSIGVYLPMLDQSRAMEQAGLVVDLIKSRKTPYKGAGYPGTSLTDDQRQDFQDGVDHLYDLFSGAVKRYRPMVSDDAMDGRTFFGTQAQAVGLIDSVASLQEAIRDAREMAS